MQHRRSLSRRRPICRKNIKCIPTTYGAPHWKLIYLSVHKIHRLQHSQLHFLTFFFIFQYWPFLCSTINPLTICNWILRFHSNWGKLNLAQSWTKSNCQKKPFKKTLIVALSSPCSSSTKPCITSFCRPTSTCFAKASRTTLSTPA